MGHEGNREKELTMGLSAEQRVDDRSKQRVMVAINKHNAPENPQGPLAPPTSSLGQHNAIGYCTLEHIPR
jgi:hypothetical protein